MPHAHADHDPRAGATPLPSGCFPPTMSPVPFNLATYLDRNLHIPPDSIHEFFREQFQIDSGRMDQFPIWNDVATPCAEYCAGASLGYWDLASLPTTTPSIAHYARQYTLMDKYHHGMFGASVPNWFWLICCVRDRLAHAGRHQPGPGPSWSRGHPAPRTS